MEKNSSISAAVGRFDTVTGLRREVAAACGGGGAEAGGCVFIVDGDSISSESPQSSLREHVSLL